MPQSLAWHKLGIWYVWVLIFIRNIILKSSSITMVINREHFQNETIIFPLQNSGINLLLITYIPQLELKISSYLGHPPWIWNWYISTTKVKARTNKVIVGHHLCWNLKTIALPKSSPKNTVNNVERTQDSKMSFILFVKFQRRFPRICAKAKYCYSDLLLSIKIQYTSLFKQSLPPMFPN